MDVYITNCFRMLDFFKKHDKVSIMNNKILIVEDEKPLARALLLKLGNVGFTVQVAFDGQEALDLLAKQEFDLILLDLVMPRVDGFGVLTEMQKKQIKTPVIILTNLGQEEDIKRAKELGAKEYFIKSATSIADVVKLVKQTIGT